MIQLAIKNTSSKKDKKQIFIQSDSRNAMINK